MQASAKSHYGFELCFSFGREYLSVCALLVSRWFHELYFRSISFWNSVNFIVPSATHTQIHINTHSVTTQQYNTTYLNWMHNIQFITLLLWLSFYTLFFIHFKAKQNATLYFRILFCSDTSFVLQFSWHEVYVYIDSGAIKIKKQSQFTHYLRNPMRREKKIEIVEQY